MWYVMKEIEELNGKELSIGDLDDTIEECYENYLEPKGFIRGNYRVYQHNNHFLLIKCHLVEKSSVIRKNKVKISEVKTMIN